MAHVDLFPTLATLAGEPTPDGMAGYDLLDGAPDDRLAYNEIEHSFLDRNPFKRQSVWDADGGYVFTDQHLTDRFIGWARNFHPGNPTRAWHRRHPVLLFKQYAKMQAERGNPGFSREQAKQFCDAIASGAKPRESTDVDEEARERLKALGYSESDIR